MTNAYDVAGYNNGEIGFGKRPAVLVVDLQKAFTDPRYPLGGFSRVHDALESTAEPLAVGRRCGVPVASCYTGYKSEADMPFWKIASVHEDFLWGHPCLEIDERVLDTDYDYSFCKSGPSIFFQTPLVTFLTKHGIDTCIVTGCMTSGCIRASVIDSFSNGFRTVVPEDCSGDAEEGPHRDNLRDVGRRYADISTGEAVAAYFEENRKLNV
jgi:maleamate amidohydrolase